nr:EOG090X06IP [Triops cancriformis]
MSNVQGLLWAISYGFLDSLRGCILIFKLDKQIRQQKASRTQSGTSTSSSRQRPGSRATKEPSKPEEAQILQRTLQCCALNGGVFWFSLLGFYGLVLPTIQLIVTFSLGKDQEGIASLVWSWMSPALSATFSTLWVLPLFLLSKVVNSLWFQDIADSAYKHSRGRPQLLPSISKLIADVLFSVVIQALFLLQGMLCSFIPIAVVNDTLFVLHMCLLYALYSFEYRWFNAGWDLPKRLTYIENYWPYFAGFGLPLAILTSLPNSYWVSGCVFSILFPLFIVSGNEAEPVLVPGVIPLRLFSPVVSVANFLFHRTIGQSSERKTTSKPVFAKS